MGLLIVLWGMQCFHSLPGHVNTHMYMYMYISFTNVYTCNITNPWSHLKFFFSINLLKSSLLKSWKIGSLFLSMNPITLYLEEEEEEEKEEEE